MVEANRALVVVTGVGLLQRSLNLGELMHLLIGDADGCPRGQFPADVGLHVGDVGDVTAGHRQHAESAARLLVDQALSAQREQRLAYGCDADSQLRGQ